MYARRVALAQGLLLCFILGCQGGYTPPPASDPQASRAKLEEVLNQWKNGSQIPALVASPASDVVRDEDWEAGRVLNGFEILSPGETFGSEVRFLVNLQVANERGIVLTKKVRFLVSLHPSCVIRRDDTTD